MLSNIEINPREHVNVITLRNDKQLEELPLKEQAKKKEQIVKEEVVEEPKVEAVVPHTNH